MRGRFVCVLMIPLLLLCGCGVRKASPEDVFSAFREELLSAGSSSFRAELRSETEGSTASYTLDAFSDGETTTVTIREPELLAGITASMRAEQTDVSYEGLMLGVGALDASGTTPVSAVPAILKAMEEGYSELYWEDGDLCAARFYVSEICTCTVWLEPESLVPSAAEIATDGRTILTCRISDWILK